MNPIIAKKLMSEIPELQEFIVFLNEEAKKLNALDGIEIRRLDDPVELAIAVKARQEALQIISDILYPLISVQDIKPSFGNREYVV